MKKKKKWIIIIILLLLVLLFFPLRSYLLMSVYSKSEQNESIFEEYSIETNLSGGLSTLKKDWYPFIMYYNAFNGFANYSNIDCDLSIIYNFASFSFPYLHSDIFNPNSDYNSSFYGAYAVKPRDDNKKYAFYDDMTINEEEAVLIPKYDVGRLVLKALGCENIELDYEIVSQKMNENNFYEMDIEIMANSMLHKYDSSRRNYVQYGIPLFITDIEESFEKTNYYAKLYMQYDEDSNVTLFYYALSPSKVTIDECDEKYLRKAINERQ